MQSHLEDVHLKKGSEFVCRLVESRFVKFDYLILDVLKNSHDTEHCSQFPNFFAFRICDEGFAVKNHLIHHMSKNHVKSEMPYLCQICGYRSSMHRDLIDHFQEVLFDLTNT
jgi:lipopolysaccharide biosynthesis regulator YciM